MFQHGLTWPQALALAMAGAFVRRELWTDKRLFRTDGGLVWVDGVPSRVVRATDFGRDEFLALDWTNMGFDQGDCIPHPGWTHLSIHETLVTTIPPPTGYSLNAPPNSTVRLVNPFGRSVTGVVTAAADFSGGVTVPHILSDRSHGNAFVAPATASNYTDVDITFLMNSGESIFVQGGLYGVAATVIFNVSSLDSTPPMQRVIPNPFTAACAVEITGTATDALLLNGVEVPLPATFTLAMGRAFTLAALLRDPATQPVASLDLEVDFTL